MHLLFTNTGVQILCIPLSSSRRFATAEIGYGWQYCRLKSPAGAKGAGDVPFVQWQIVQAQTTRLFLAVDTSLGDPAQGHVCAPEALAGDHRVALEGLLDLTGEPLHHVPSIDLCFRAATAATGDVVPVDLVVDFGNSRTGALLLEASTDATAPAKMMPFELLDRFRLDAWDDDGRPSANPSAQWFSSKTRWCNAPYRTPQPLVHTEEVRQTVRSLWGRKTVLRKRQRQEDSDLFEDLSLARVGREADDLGQHISLQGDLRLGLSSPKRYLWADDDRWLEGAFWHMADPYDRCRSGMFASKLAGRLLAYLDDGASTEETTAATPATSTEEGVVAPAKPRYAPRTLMTAALYELLCQAYCFVNSPRYRDRAGDAARSREIRSLSLSYPSGMLQEERLQWRRQAKRAIRIFRRTLGKRQLHEPALHFGIDEAGAVHLAYLWSEWQLLGRDPQLWFTLLGRRPQVPEEPPDGSSAGRMSAPTADEVRIACIDIGGGTSNLMIAGYRCQSGIDDTVRGRVLHRDGASTAGDHLVKRLLERIIVPAFTTAVGLEPADALLLFGPEVPHNRGFRARRIEWMNRLFLPLAEAYLRRSADVQDATALSHTNPDLVDPVVLESLGAVCNQLRGVGYYNLRQELRLPHDDRLFEAVVHEVFDELIFDFCERITAYDVDMVLLAGRPTKLQPLRDILTRYLPLPESRIIAMHQHYAGNWYPYQDADGGSPGRIADPKSTVVVGAAIQFLADNGRLPQFRFHSDDLEYEVSYHWGVMVDSHRQIRPERILFRPVGDATERGRDVVEFRTGSQRLLIGRIGGGDPRAQAAPVYLLTLETGGRVGPSDVAVRLRRVRAARDAEEHLELDSLTGTVAGEPAVLEQNVFFRWHTLADERFFLDTGGLDRIDWEAQTC